MLTFVNTIIREVYKLPTPYPSLHQYEPDSSSQFSRKRRREFLVLIIPNNQAVSTYDIVPLTEDAQLEHLVFGPWFWDRRCLILLANLMDIEQRFCQYIQAVVARTKANNVAVVQIQGSTFSHSNVIHFLAAYGKDEDSFIKCFVSSWVLSSLSTTSCCR